MWTAAITLHYFSQIKAVSNSPCTDSVPFNMNPTNHFNCRTIGSSDLETKLLSEPFHPLFPQTANTSHTPVGLAPIPLGPISLTSTWKSPFRVFLSISLSVPPKPPKLSSEPFHPLLLPNLNYLPYPSNNTVKTTCSLTLVTRSSSSGPLIGWSLVGHITSLLTNEMLQKVWLTHTYIHEEANLMVQQQRGWTKSVCPFGEEQV